jgi:hypothetical protein
MKRVGMILGLVLLLFAGLWYFVLRNNFNLRFPDGWEWTVNTLGQSSFADETSGQFPEDSSLSSDPINNTERVVQAESIAGGLVKISDRYEQRDPVTEAVTWEFTYEATVNAATGQYPDGEFAGDYYFLPRNVEQSSYTIRNTSYQGLPVSFQREEVVNGINTYLFAFQGDLDNTAAYSYISLEEGQKVVCFDFELNYWVEPNTGEILKYREWCEGDWVVDASGERIYAISRWGGETDGADLIRQASVVQSALMSYQAVNVYIPVVSAVLGIILLLIAGYLQMNSSKPSQKKVAA